MAEGDRVYVEDSVVIAPQKEIRDAKILARLIDKARALHLHLHPASARSSVLLQSIDMSASLAPECNQVKECVNLAARGH